MKDYFKKFTKNVSFIELKHGTFVDVNGYKVGGETPLPIMVDDIVEEVKENSEEIKFVNMVNGMIYTIGVDADFPHAEEYIRILNAFAENMENYIIHMGMQKMEEKKTDEAMIFFRAAYAINPINLVAIYNYSIALEERAKEAYEKDDKKLGTEFLTEAMTKMEEVLEKDDKSKFPMSLYKLGFYYKAFHKFVKAKEIWEEFLTKSEDEEAKQDIRGALEAMEDDVVYETGYGLVLDGKPKEGVEMLLPLTEKYEKWWNLDFVIGVGMRQLGLYDRAVTHFKKVLEVNPAQIDTLNEMGLCKANLGDMVAALEFFDKASKMDPKNYEIICNRGMAKLQMGDRKGAINDIDRASKLSPEDEIVKACLKVIAPLREQN